MEWQGNGREWQGNDRSGDALHEKQKKRSYLGVTLRMVPSQLEGRLPFFLSTRLSPWCLSLSLSLPLSLSLSLPLFLSSALSLASCSCLVIYHSAALLQQFQRSQVSHDTRSALQIFRGVLLKSSSDTHTPDLLRQLRRLSQRP
eukprot:scaffold4678_cov242-Pinguiococcus_pyrenoidosus.AAC.2